MKATRYTRRDPSSSPMSSQLNRIIDTIIDTIVLFRDHFIVKRHITLTEGFLFLLSLVRSVWFSIFGVQLGPTTGPLTHEAWMPIFWLLTFAHFGSFFLRRIRYRAAVVFLYAFLWGVLAILVGLTTLESPATPTFSLFALVAAFLVVRLLREGQVQTGICE